MAGVVEKTIRIKDEASNKIEKLGKELKQGKISQDKYDKGLEEINRDSKKAAVSADKLTTSVKKQSSAFAKMGSAAQHLHFIASAFKQVAAAAAVPIDTFVEFEKGLAQVATLLDEVQEAEFMSAYEQGLKDLAIASGETFDNLNKGLYDLISAGVDASDAMDVLDTATRAAQAGATDTTVAVDGITTVMNAMSIGSAEAADIMFTAVKAGKLTFEELSSSLGQVLPMAYAAGVGFEEVGSAIAEMTAQGINTAQATTALNALLVEFTRPATIKKFQDAGIELLDATTGELRNIGDIMTEAMEKGFSTVEMGELITSVEAKKAFLALTSEAENAAGDIVSTLEAGLEDFSPENLSGAMEDAYGDMANTTENQLERMAREYDVMMLDIGESLSQLKLELGTAFMPLFDTLMNTFMPIVSEISSAISSIAIDTGILDTIQSVGTAIATIIRYVSEWELILDVVYWTFEQIGNIADSITLSLGGSDLLKSAAVKEIKDDIENLNSLLEDNKKKTQDINNLWGSAKDAIEGQGNLLETIRELEKVSPDLADEIDNLVDVEGNLIGTQDELNTVFQRYIDQQKELERVSATDVLDKQLELIGKTSDIEGAGFWEGSAGFMRVEQEKDARAQMWKDLEGPLASYAQKVAELYQLGDVDTSTMLTGQAELMEDMARVQKKIEDGTISRIDGEKQLIKLAGEYRDIQDNQRSIAENIVEGYYTLEEVFGRAVTATGDIAEAVRTAVNLNIQLEEIDKERVRTMRAEKIVIAEKLGIDKNILANLNLQDTVYQKLKNLANDTTITEKQRLQTLLSILRTEAQTLSAKIQYYSITARGVAGGPARLAALEDEYEAIKGKIEEIRKEIALIPDLTPSTGQTNANISSTSGLLATQQALMRSLVQLQTDYENGTLNTLTTEQQLSNEYDKRINILNQIKSQYGGAGTLEGTSMDAYLVEALKVYPLEEFGVNVRSEIDALILYMQDLYETQRTEALKGFTDQETAFDILTKQLEEQITDYKTIESIRTNINSLLTDGKITSGEYTELTGILTGYENDLNTIYEERKEDLQNQLDLIRETDKEEKIRLETSQQIAEIQDQLNQEVEDEIITAIQATELMGIQTTILNEQRDIKIANLTTDRDTVSTYDQYITKINNQLALLDATAGTEREILQLRQQLTALTGDRAVSPDQITAILNKQRELIIAQETAKTIEEEAAARKNILEWLTEQEAISTRLADGTDEKIAQLEAERDEKLAMFDILTQSADIARIEAVYTGLILERKTAISEETAKQLEQEQSRTRSLEDRLINLNNELGLANDMTDKEHEKLRLEQDYARTQTELNRDIAELKNIEGDLTEEQQKQLVFLESIKIAEGEIYNIALAAFAVSEDQTDSEEEAEIIGTDRLARLQLELAILKEQNEAEKKRMRLRYEIESIKARKEEVGVDPDVMKELDVELAILLYKLGQVVEEIESVGKAAQEAFDWEDFIEIKPFFDIVDIEQLETDLKEYAESLGVGIDDLTAYMENELSGAEKINFLEATGLSEEELDKEIKNIEDSNILEKGFVDLIPGIVKGMAEEFASDLGGFLGDAISGDDIALEDVGKSIGGVLAGGMSTALEALMPGIGGMIGSVLGPAVTSIFGALFDAFGGGKSEEEKITERLEKQLEITKSQVNHIKNRWDAISTIYENLPEFSNEYDSAIDKLKILRKEMQDYTDHFELSQLSEEERIEKITKLKLILAERERALSRETNEHDKLRLETLIEELGLEIGAQETMLDYQRQELQLQREVTNERYKQLELMEEITDITVGSLLERLETSYDTVLDSIKKGLGSDVIKEDLGLFISNLKEALSEGLITSADYEEMLQPILDYQASTEQTLSILEKDQKKFTANMIVGYAELGKLANEMGISQPGLEKIIEDSQEWLKTLSEADLKTMAEDTSGFIDPLKRALAETEYWNRQLSSVGIRIDDANEKLLDTDLMSSAISASEDERLGGLINILDRELEQKKALLELAKLKGDEAEAAKLETEINDLYGQRISLLDQLIEYMKEGEFIGSEVHGWVMERLNTEKEITDQLEQQNGLLSTQDTQLAALLRQRQRSLLAGAEGVGGGFTLPESTAAMSSQLLLQYPDPLEFERMARLLNLPGFAAGGLVDRDMFALIHQDERVLTPAQNRNYENNNTNNTNNNSNMSFNFGDVIVNGDANAGEQFETQVIDTLRNRGIRILDLAK